MVGGKKTAAILAIIALFVPAGGASDPSTEVLHCTAAVGGVALVMHHPLVGFVGGCPLGTTTYGGIVRFIDAGPWCGVYASSDGNNLFGSDDEISEGDRVGSGVSLMAFCGPGAIDEDILVLIDI